MLGIFSPRGLGEGNIGGGGEGSLVLVPLRGAAGFAVVHAFALMMRYSML